jgi:putative addiction module component (TIGR02574 family)
MSAEEILEQIRRLPPEEQHEVVEKIRREFGEFDDELTPEQIAELERRAEEMRQHPERGRPLEDVVADIEKRFRAR